MFTEWVTNHPKAYDYLGFIPGIISALDPRSVAAQIDTGYIHGGGYQPMQGFKYDPVNRTIKYPGDPAYQPVAWSQINDELVIVYPYAWVAIVQKDGTFAVTRMD